MKKNKVHYRLVFYEEIRTCRVLLGKWEDSPLNDRWESSLEE